MIVIRVWGGIGNQLFQYVFGEYLRHKYNQEVTYDDGSFESVDTLRKRELDNLVNQIVYNSNFSFSKCRGIKNRLLRTLFHLHPKHHLIIEGKNKVPFLFKEGHTYYFQGYWQTIEYYKWLIRNVHQFKIISTHFPSQLEELKNLIGANDKSVSVHVRRGDYFSSHNIKTYGVCTEDYYHTALSHILNKEPNAKVFVFSDDLEWVRNNIKLPHNAVIIPNYDISQFAYIELMSHCKHHIISNSSFSWWGAVLNEQSNAIVISPNKWTLTSNSTIALTKWVKILC